MSSSFFGYLCTLEVASIIMKGLVMGLEGMRREMVEAKERCDISTNTFS